MSLLTVLSRQSLLPLQTYDSQSLDPSVKEADTVGGSAIALSSEAPQSQLREEVSVSAKESVHPKLTHLLSPRSH